MKYRLQSNKQPSTRDGLHTFARRYMESQRSLTPLIRAQGIPPAPALTLIAIYTDARLAGAVTDHRMSLQDIKSTTSRLLTLWKTGFFTPSPDYPFTLTETLASLSESERGG